jgi:hypothetical protein
MVLTGFSVCHAEVFQPAWTEGQRGVVGCVRGVTYCSWRGGVDEVSGEGDVEGGPERGRGPGGG